MKEAIIEWIRQFYTSYSNGHRYFDETAYNSHTGYWAMGMFAALLIASYLTWQISRFVMLQIVGVAIDKTKTHWDDYLVKNKFFRALAHVVPLMFMDYFLSICFYRFPRLNAVADKVLWVFITIVIILIINRFLSTVRDILSEKDAYKDKPIQSYFQVAKIVIAGICIIFLIAALTGVPTINILGSLGAISAIILLIFRDTILGFVGSLQLAANDMVRLGDWVTMEKFGADGTVEEINLATVKVRNFDKTITTIPTYSFISDSFKNWRGMEESDGRRIKRAIKINIESVRFADDALFDRLKQLVVLQEFIVNRQKEIDEYNETNGFVGDNAVNARRQTNLGIFRRYVQYYLRHKVEINQEMTLMVRQLEPTDTGIPIEIYCFTKTKEWEVYEGVISDIFDHIISMVHLFDLQIFEQPSGRDFRAFLAKEA